MKNEAAPGRLLQIASAYKFGRLINEKLKKETFFHVFIIYNIIVFLRTYRFFCFTFDWPTCLIFIKGKIFSGLIQDYPQRMRL